MTDQVTRIARTCDRCNVTDSHAHHVQLAALVHPITGASLDVSISRHVQCCALEGCAICATDVEFAPEKSIGDAFTGYVQAKTPDHLAALSSRHGISVPGGA